MANQPKPKPGFDFPAAQRVCRDYRCARCRGSLLLDFHPTEPSRYIVSCRAGCGDVEEVGRVTEHFHVRQEQREILEWREVKDLFEIDEQPRTEAEILASLGFEEVSDAD